MSFARPERSCLRHRAASGRRSSSGSVLVPVIAGMLILLLLGVSLSELFGAQRMQGVLAVEAVQAFWIAEAGIWHAAHEDAEITTPVSFALGSYTVTRSGSTYTGTGDRNNATRVVSVSLDTSGGSGGSGPMPIAHWNLDESTGLTAADSIGSNDGTLQNGVGWGLTGSDGTAASFDGSNDYIEVPHSSDFVLDEGTVQLWFYADNLSGRQELFSKDSNGYDTGGHFTMWIDGDDVDVRVQSASASYYLDASGILSAQTWHHVAVCFGSGGLQLYVDGALRDLESYTGGWGTTTGGVGNSEPIAIGAGTWGSGDGTVTPLNYYFDGRIDAVAVYDVALSATEVSDLYAGGGAIP